MATAFGSTTQKVLFTDRYLKSLKPAPAGKQITIWDANVKGFGVRISDKATADGKAANLSFVVMRRLPGASAPTRATLGRYPGMSLAKAREQAGDALQQIAGGTKPAEEKRRREREETERRASTVAAVAADFIADMKRRKLRNAGEFESIIRREFLGQVFKAGEWTNGRDRGWRDRPIADISDQDAARLIRAILGRGTDPKPGQRRRGSGGPWSAHHALAIGKTMFNWAIDQHAYPIKTSPFDRLRPKRLIGAKKPRQRILTDAELRVIWRAAEKLGGPYGDLVRLLMATGQRLSQAAQLQRGEVDIDKALWITPAEKMKKEKAHATPLASAPLALLRERLNAPSHRNGYLFSTTAGERPISGFSKFKVRLDGIITGMLRDEEPQADPLPEWTLHDLRRTLRSGVPALGVSDVVAEAILAHARPGIAGVYDLYDYLPEKRAALEKWAVRLSAIVEPPPLNVVPMRRVVE